MIDRVLIPEERASRNSNTCSKECAARLKSIRRLRAEQRKCRVCAKPSTPEQRKLYKAWLRSQPEHAPKKRGRKPKAEAASA